MSDAASRVQTRLPVQRFLDQVDRFLRIEAASGIILLVAAAAALLWANSPWRASYEALWHLPISLGIGPFVSEESLHFWINDGLMAIFFLIVGLEIRHEMHAGALSTARQAALPVIAALGGVLAPAAIYFALNAQQPDLRNGWAVPTATDIAFAVGVLALLGRRVPPQLRVLLLALAIIDDIAAIVVIALFYSSGVSLAGLAIGAAGIVVTLLFQRFGIRTAWLYLVPGALVWYGMIRAGIHPAISGVIMGLLTPVAFPDSSADPLSSVRGALHPWVAYGIMPLFAFANAGVSLAGLDFSSDSFMSVSLGVIGGLVLGKPLGIVLATLLSVRLGVSRMPEGVGLRAVLVMGCLGGIGFTMAIFISNLAFTDAAVLATSKFAVLIASTIAAILGLVAGRVLLAPVRAS